MREGRRKRDSGICSMLMASRGATGTCRIGWEWRSQAMKTEKQHGTVPVTHKLKVRTSRRTELKDVTAEIAEVVKESGCENGMCYLYVPHTTAEIGRASC